MKYIFICLLALSGLLFLNSCTDDSGNNEILTLELRAGDAKSLKGCLELVFPVKVEMPDGTILSGEDAESLKEAIKNWYHLNPLTDRLYTLVFPLEIIFRGEVYTVLNQEEFNKYKRACEDVITDSAYDCPELKANFGDRCKLDNGQEGFINRDCKCQPRDVVFDCPEIGANYGDKCKTDDGQEGFINKDCKCQPRDVVFDCPEIGANYGDKCKTDDGQEGFINKDCKCQPRDVVYDCPEIKANFRDKCRNDKGHIGFINRHCKCQTRFISDAYYDCPKIKANFRDKCRLDNGDIGFINKDCKCKAKDG